MAAVTFEVCPISSCRRGSRITARSDGLRPNVGDHDSGFLSTPRSHPPLSQLENSLGEGCRRSDQRTGRKWGPACIVAHNSLSCELLTVTSNGRGGKSREAPSRALRHRKILSSDILAKVNKAPQWFASSWSNTVAPSNREKKNAAIRRSHLIVHDAQVATCISFHCLYCALIIKYSFLSGTSEL